MFKQIQNTKKTIKEMSIADGFVMTIDKTKQKRNRTVQVQSEHIFVESESYI